MDLANTGWTDEARKVSLAVRRAKAAARAKVILEGFRRDGKLAREQVEVCVKDDVPFVKNWYPREGDGAEHAPHWGKTGPEAPYGYSDVTGEPRKEPLFDEDGWPIVPREYDEREEEARKSNPMFVAPAAIGIKEKEHKTRGVETPWQRRRRERAEERYATWQERAKEVRDEWGRFGEKNRWMEAHPEASETEWKAAEKKMRAAESTLELEVMPEDVMEAGRER